MSMFSIGAKKWPGISKLVEEAGEVLQVCGKLMGKNGEIAHWNVPDLKSALEDELADLMAAMCMVMVTCGLDEEGILKRADEKTTLFQKWHLEGLLREDPQVMVTCAVCEKPCRAISVHTHQGTFIGEECCWNVRSEPKPIDLYKEINSLILTLGGRYTIRCGINYVDMPDGSRWDFTAPKKT